MPQSPSLPLCFTQEEPFILPSLILIQFVSAWDFDNLLSVLFIATKFNTADKSPWGASEIPKFTWGSINLGCYQMHSTSFLLQAVSSRSSVGCEAMFLIFRFAL